MKTLRNYVSFKIGFFIRTARALIFIFLTSLYVFTDLFLKDENNLLQNISIFVTFVTFIEMTLINYQEKLFGTWFMAERHKETTCFRGLMYLTISLSSTITSIFSLFYLFKNYSDDSIFMVLVPTLVLLWIITKELGYWVATQVYFKNKERIEKYPNYKFQL